MEHRTFWRCAHHSNCIASSPICDLGFPSYRPMAETTSFDSIQDIIFATTVEAITITPINPTNLDREKENS